MNECEKAMRSLLRRAVEQCTMILDSGMNRETHPATIKAMALGFILRELKTQAEKLRASVETHDDADAYLRAYQKLTSFATDVNLKLPELAKEWRCRACETDMAKAAAISRLKEGAPMVSLRCAACNTLTGLTEEGMERFRHIFSENLKEPTWNPRLNGFEWSGS
jgi:RNase P subunit RPR2